MIKYVALFLALSASAMAQTVPTIPRSGISSTGAAVSTAADVAGAIGTKADVTNGVLTNPTLTGGTASSVSVAVPSGPTNTLATWMGYLSGAFNPNEYLSPGFNTATVSGSGGNASYGTLGSIWQSQGHANWNVVETNLNYNPTEWQVYGAQGQGKAHCDNPGVTGVVDFDSGTPFTSAWTGRAAFYIQPQGNQHAVYTVASVASASQLTLSTACQGAGSQTFHFVTTTNDGTVNVSGTAVTWMSGQPFNVFTTGSGQWTINGTPGYTCSVVSLTSATCNTSGTAAGAAYHTDANINDEITTWRLQKVLGTNEENLTCTARAVGSYDCRPQFAAAGTLWPWQLGNGNLSFGGGQQNQVVLQPNGDLTLGGNYLLNTLLIPAQTGQFSENFFEMQPGLSGTGTTSPALSARPCGTCSDASVGIGFDVFGAGGYAFTSHSFTNTEFQIFGVGGSSWLAVGSSASAAPSLSANGAAANISIGLTTKGTGTIVINGSPGVSCTGTPTSSFATVDGIVVHC